MTIKAVDVKFQRNIPAMSGRRLRALLHKAYVAGNDSYEPHETQKGLEERNQFIADLLLHEGLAQQKVPQ